jgi:hypothetical protein
VVLAAEVCGHTRVCGAGYRISCPALRHGRHVRQRYFAVRRRMDCGHESVMIVGLNMRPCLGVTPSGASRRRVDVSCAQPTAAHGPAVTSGRTEDLDTCGPGSRSSNPLDSLSASVLSQ